MKSILYALLSKLSLVLVALAATTTATYPVTPLPANPVSRAEVLPPVLERVAACESTGDPNGTPRQFNNDGTPLWGNDPTTGKPVMRDVGIFQINTWVHADELKKLGLDVVHSEADNETYALILYRRNGLKDWAASKGCWLAA